METRSSETFALDITATTSAVTAQVDFGDGLVNADAFVAVDFAIMTPSPVPAATLASFGLPSLPALTALPPNVESLNAKAEIGPYGAPTTTILMAMGYAGSVLPLVLGPWAGPGALLFSGLGLFGRGRRRRFAAADRPRNRLTSRVRGSPGPAPRPSAACRGRDSGR